jgi:hypothetical protein
MHSFAVQNWIVVVIDLLKMMWKKRLQDYFIELFKN